MLQVSQSQESPLLSSPPGAATDSGDKSAKKRSSSKVSRFNVENISTLSKALMALKIKLKYNCPSSTVLTGTGYLSYY